MIRKLRVKFICVIMVILMVMLSGILGVIVHFTAQNMEMQSINMMRGIVKRPFQHSSLQKPDQDVRLPFFTVQVNNSGQLIAASGGYFDLTDHEDIQKIVDAAMQFDSETGVLKEINLRYLKSSVPRGVVIVFADTTAEEMTLRHLVSSCLLIFFVASVVFLGISILLSRLMIKPVAVAWDQQRQFVADASHELKTPLSVIMANAELMQNEDTVEDDRNKYARNILDMTYQMRTLVENMLEMAKVDNGSLKMQFEDLDFSQLVMDTVLSFQLLYEEQGLKLLSFIQPEICLHGSEQYLYQVLDVSLDNALKYSNAKGTVAVKLETAGKHCILSVESQGMELSKEDLKNIFKRFYRADKARSMNGSYGLGLSIAESIVAAHKGKIWAQSEYGRNTFYVQFSINDNKTRETPFAYL